MKDQNRRKGNIISIRMSDDERDVIQEIMEKRNTKASNVMREAFNLFKEQWEMSRRMEGLIEN